MSDLSARELLAEAGAHKCHRLHFLQMAAEKVCKAFLIDQKGHANLRRTHAYVRKNLPLIARMLYSDLNDQNRINPWQLSEIRKISYEIEIASPACTDGGAREDNTEYPWQPGSGDLKIPCEYNFPNIDDGVRSNAFVLIVKVLRFAAHSYIE